MAKQQLAGRSAVFRGGGIRGAVTANCSPSEMGLVSYTFRFFVPFETLRYNATNNNSDYNRQRDWLLF